MGEIPAKGLPLECVIEGARFDAVSSLRVGAPIQRLQLAPHAGDDPVEWVVPSGWGDLWSVFADTADMTAMPSTRHHHPGEVIAISPRSLVVLLRV